MSNSSRSEKIMFDTVVLVGIGLLGGSLARDLRANGLAKHIVGVCRSELTAELALKESVVDEILPLGQAVKKADLIAVSYTHLTLPTIYSV